MTGLALGEAARLVLDGVDLLERTPGMGIDRIGEFGGAHAARLAFEEGAYLTLELGHRLAERLTRDEAAAGRLGKRIALVRTHEHLERMHVHCANPLPMHHGLDDYPHSP